MEARQLIDDQVLTVTATVPPTASTSPVIAKQARCPTVNLQSGGVVTLSDGQVITLQSGTVYKPPCIIPPIIANGGGGTISIEEVDGAGSDPRHPGDHLSDFHDPFYASMLPQCYALAATTIVAYTLVIMLLITPRSFLDGGVVVLGRKGFTNGGSGTNIGGRPWLQKVAALTVAVSLTIATAATFRVAEEQHAEGYLNAKMIQQDVLGGLEIKIIRIISDTFLWLAQAQTLIRLFPRQREKVIIKWTAFALISLDVVFQSLNSFQYMGQGAIRPRSFTDAVPALSYLFALSLGVLYAAWVIYYSLMKKRYAFYHPQMKNICLVAALSMLAILVPVVFFILDISKPEFTGWGDYVRWVGAAAASVIVWEWVERIEALEREEKKDGILGREVFDGDEMLEATLSDIGWSRRRRKGPDDGDGESGRKDNGQGDGTSTARGHLWPHVSSIASRYRSRSRQRKADQAKEATEKQPTNHERIRFSQPPLWPARPPPVVTPISRTDTASAASTVYAVRYHPLTETTSRPSPPPPPQDNDTSLARTDSNSSGHRREDGAASTLPDLALDGTQEPAVGPVSTAAPSPHWWRSMSRSVSIPRVGRSSKEEVPTTTEVDNTPKEKSGERDNSARWDIRTRLEEFAVTQAERLRERIRPTPDTDSLPVTVIPAPPRRGAALAQLREEEELELAQRHGMPRRNSTGRGASSTEGGSSRASSNQYNPYGAGPGPGIGPVARGGDSSFFGGVAGRRSNRTLPVTVIPAPPRRDGAVPNSTAPTPESASSEKHSGEEAYSGPEPGAGPSSPPCS
ncbi:PalH/RIM21 domain containing protein [Rhypophila decipiens]